MVSTKTFELFIGTWSLMNITRTQNQAEVPNYTFGAQPHGVIQYTRDGYISACLTATESEVRPLDLTLPAEPHQPDQQWALVGKHALAYSGPFHFNDSSTVSDTKGEVVHGPLITASLPEFVGSSQGRQFEFFDGGQVLNLVGDYGNGYADHLWWRKLAPRDCLAMSVKPDT